MPNISTMIKNPDIIYEMLLDGSLKKDYPEIFNLFGVPQNPTYHPEIDCGVHTVMALKQVEKYFTNEYFKPFISLAILCHDFGKATTPKDILPKHINHEVRGVPIAEHFLERVDFVMTNRQREFVLKFVEHHTRLYGYIQANVGTIVNTLVIFNTTSYFNEVVCAGMCDKMGRGWDDQSYQNAYDKNTKMLRFWLSIQGDYIELINTTEYKEKFASRTYTYASHNFVCSKMTSCIKAKQARYS